MGAAQSMWLNVYEYVNELASSVQNTITKGAVDQLSADVIANLSKTMPGVSQALGLAAGLEKGIASVTGQGSLLSRAADAALSGNVITAPLNVAKAIINGRTYTSGDYAFALWYKRYVMSVNYTQGVQCSDQDVLDAYKWISDKLGVYITGTAPLLSLKISPQNYMALNTGTSPNYITQDPVRVEAAYEVAKTMPLGPGNDVLGQWADVVGVYDDPLLAAILATNKVTGGSQSGILTAAVESAGSIGSTVGGYAGYVLVGVLLLILWAFGFFKKGSKS